MERDLSLANGAAVRGPGSERMASRSVDLKAGEVPRYSCVACGFRKAGGELLHTVFDMRDGRTLSSWGQAKENARAC